MNQEQKLQQMLSLHGETTFSANADKVLCTAIDIGENMLRCGGEIHRVEETVTRVCRALGARHVEVFTITSLIVGAVRMEDGGYSSQVRRVYGSSNNLWLLEKLNGISRRICEGNLLPDDAQEEIKQAKKVRIYPKMITILGAMIAAGGFAVFFGGEIRDGIGAAIAGLPIALLDIFRPSRINRFIYTCMNAFLSGVCAILTTIVGLSLATPQVMIGSIMLLIPGVAFGNALRDMLSGDTISGILRMIESLLLAAMIAFGYYLANLFLGGFLP